MKSFVLILLLHIFGVALGSRHHEAHAAREAIDEQIKRAMFDRVYRATTMYSTFQFNDKLKTATAEEAIAFCRKHGGRTMNLNTKRKAEIFDAQYVSGMYRWIGAKKEKLKKGKLTWNTGEDVEPSNLNWITGSAPCIYTEAAITSAVWSDDCTTNWGITCEYDSRVMPRTGFTTVKASTSLIVVPISLTFDQAEAKCKELFEGGTLATPSTFRQLNATDKLIEELGGGSFWLGAKRDRSITGHTWNNGFKIVGNLRKFVPENGGNCLGYFNSEFDFFECDTLPTGFVCQIDK